MRLVEADITDEDFALLSNTDEDCYFSEQDYIDFIQELDKGPKRKIVCDLSGDEAGMQLHQYWMDNQDKYPNIPEDIAGDDDYYFDFMDNLQAESQTEYDKLIDDFIKSGEFKI